MAVVFKTVVAAEVVIVGTATVVVKLKSEVGQKVPTELTALAVK